MEQTERRRKLIAYLLSEKPQYQDIQMPTHDHEQRQLLRSLMNVREAAPIDGTVLQLQDEYLSCALEEKGITDIGDLTPVEDGIYLWQGDITTLRCGAIVNAANSGMTGCYVPCHACIDNCIHTFAGIQLRLECAERMEQQGFPEPTGKAKLTGAYNLPCDYVLHTVGPIIRGRVRKQDEALLASCYRSCLELAKETGIRSVAFCCISTGVFCFPNQRAAEIAVDTVRRHRGEIEVIFNVFKTEDYNIYRKLLG